MDFISEKQNGITVIKSLGTLNNLSNGSSFRQFAIDIIDKGDNKIIYDMSNVTLLDSTFLGAMVVVHRKLVSLGSRLVLTGVGESISVLLGLTKLNEAFIIYPTLEKAIESI